ncbi:histidine phosphatase family protein [Gulosibacter molinativorax]|uniref:Histidine phosphatase family protein n=1 Tax=Gulosibacter molinativorax TaxID=256821 RepID=A0ABT7C3K2_9MICO|nr:histidine phosphatase family protein [Gulosibacter molinativorax]MDJ1369832.1 histidine phosphatase family protein [Gulosibacter molinativorax]QUY61797.1 GmpB protein [Gulosibacter molinativorax]
MSHFLYLVRHGEQENAEHGIAEGPLSERGRAQAHAIGRKLARVPFTRALTSPLERAVDTAAIIDTYTQGPSFEQSNLLFDCVPSSGESAPAHYDSFFSGVEQADIEAGQAQMNDAITTFFTRSREDEHTLLVTHNFVIGYFVRELLGLPEWNWLTLSTGNTALTVLRLRSVRPDELKLFGDLSHLEPQDRTGINWYADV